jgi:hypothetical protein
MENIGFVNGKVLCIAKAEQDNRQKYSGNKSMKTRVFWGVTPSES